MRISEITTYTDDQGRQITRAGPGQKVISKSDDTGTTRYDASGKPIKQISPKVSGLQKTTDLRTGTTTTTAQNTVAGTTVNQTSVNGKPTNIDMSYGDFSIAANTEPGKKRLQIGYQISPDSRMDVDTNQSMKKNIAQLNKLRNIGK